MARVLIVDDHLLNAELARFVLERAGLEVSVAADANEALAELQRQRPELILMDIQLPGTDGLALTQRIREDDRLRGVVIVALTAYAMKGDAARFLQAGCDGYMAKPINVHTFASEVLRYLTPPVATEDGGFSTPKGDSP